MVTLVRRGKSQREVARRVGVTLRTVQRWIDRAGEQPLASVNWKARSHAPRRVANKTHAVLEREVCALRKRLATESALGFHRRAGHSRGAPRPASACRCAERADDRTHSGAQRFTRRSATHSSNSAAAGLVSARRSATTGGARLL
jgi:hypothetical protein